MKHRPSQQKILKGAFLRHPLPLNDCQTRRYLAVFEGCKKIMQTANRLFDRLLLGLHSQGKDVIFMETAKRLGDPRSHGFVECIPVPPKVSSFLACSVPQWASFSSPQHRS